MTTRCPGWEYRIKAFNFMNSFKKDLLKLRTPLDAILNFYRHIKQDKRLLDFMQYTLAFGNYMNGKSKRGGAWGFKFDSLLKACITKTVDKKTMLT